MTIDVSLSVKDKEIKDQLDKAYINLNNSLKDILEKAATLIIVAESAKTFEVNGRRGGHDRWEPLSEYTILSKMDRGKDVVNILQETGKLKNSIRILNVNEKEVTVGSNLEYAPIHQFGGRNEQGYYVPKREFLFWAPDGSDLDKVQKFFTAYLENLL